MATPASAAEPWPARPIRLISPFAPGGGNDFVSRSVAQPLSRSLGQQVVVDNRPGANTIVGMEIVAKAAPDGHTIIMTSSTQSINATLYPKLPYDTLRDFAPVSIVASSPLIVVAHPALGIDGIPALIAAARARPGQLAYPSAGTGNVTHLAGELFATMAGVEILHVPYKGAAPGFNDLFAGRLAIAFGTVASVAQHIQSGRLRALAVTGSARSGAMPDLPTVAESGVPGYEAGTWYGIVAPARTPGPVIERLHAGIAAAVRSPEVSSRFLGQGIDPVGNAPDAFARYLNADIARWAGVLKRANVKPETH